MQFSFHLNFFSAARTITTSSVTCVRSSHHWPSGSVHTHTRNLSGSAYCQRTRNSRWRDVRVDRSIAHPCFTSNLRCPDSDSVLECPSRGDGCPVSRPGHVWRTVTKPGSACQQLGVHARESAFSGGNSTRFSATEFCFRPTDRQTDRPDRDLEGESERES